MTLRYLLDTNVVSEVTTPQPNAGVLRWLEGLPTQLPVLPFDEAAAHWLGA